MRPSCSSSSHAHTYFSTCICKEIRHYSYNPRSDTAFISLYSHRVYQPSSLIQILYDYRPTRSITLHYSRYLFYLEANQWDRHQKNEPPSNNTIHQPRPIQSPRIIRIRSRNYSLVLCNSSSTTPYSSTTYLHDSQFWKSTCKRKRVSSKILILILLISFLSLVAVFAKYTALCTALYSYWPRHSILLVLAGYFSIIILVIFLFLLLPRHPLPLLNSPDLQLNRSSVSPN